VEWISKEALERRARILEQMVRRRGTMVDFNPQDAQRVSDLLRRVIQREMASDHPTRALIQDALKSQQVATAVVLTHVSPTMLWS
jgi:phosphoribosyl 1,2-cyclic phosphodiesterase